VPKRAREMGRDSGARTQSQKEAMEKFIIKRNKSVFQQLVTWSCYTSHWILFLEMMV
jgi:hypothetical protein